MLPPRDTIFPAGYETDEYRPGVHLTSKGYEILFDKLMKLIEKNWPELLPGSLPFVFPAYNELTGDLPA
jgi:hypothetical protein